MNSHRNIEHKAYDAKSYFIQNLSEVMQEVKVI